MRPGYGKKKAKKFKKLKKKDKGAAAAGEVEMEDAQPAAAPRATPEAAAIAYAAAVDRQQGGTAKERLRAKLQLKRALRVKNLKPKKKKGR